MIKFIKNIRLDILKYILCHFKYSTVKKIKYIPLICFAFILSQQLTAQKNANRFNLAGKVTAAKTGLSLGGASIYIADLKTGTIADSNGNYVLHNIPAGNYVVVAGYVGYKNILKTISFTQNINSDFSLVESITEELEVVVTGSSKATSLRRNRPLPPPRCSPRRRRGSRRRNRRSSPPPGRKESRSGRAPASPVPRASE